MAQIDKSKLDHYPRRWFFGLFAGAFACRRAASGSVFFSDASKPVGILRIPGEITPETAARIKAIWEAAYSGTHTIRLPAVLPLDSVVDELHEHRTPHLMEALRGRST